MKNIAYLQLQRDERNVMFWLVKSFVKKEISVEQLIDIFVSLDSIRNVVNVTSEIKRAILFKVKQDDILKYIDESKISDTADVDKLLKNKEKYKEEIKELNKIIYYFTGVKNTKNVSIFCKILSNKAKNVNNSKYFLAKVDLLEFTNSKQITYNEMWEEHNKVENSNDNNELFINNNSEKVYRFLSGIISRNRVYNEFVSVFDRESLESFLFNIYKNYENNIKIKKRLKELAKKLKKHNFISQNFSFTKEMQAYKANVNRGFIR
ncbi:hypothetical protein OWM07_03195 [Deferribacter thermophilus]|uniref:hypothetical protein n=1 Tax=Deferribacter thermophilus TaxID=53573 RepID=UPI003C2A923F